jgi:hypothetical protein
MRPGKEEVAGCYRKLRKEKLQHLYFSRDIFVMRRSRIFLWAGHVTRKRSVRIPFLELLGKPERMRRRRRGKINIKVSRNGIGCVRMWMGYINRHNWWNVLNVICGMFVSSWAGIYFCLAEEQTILPRGGSWLVLVNAHRPCVPEMSAACRIRSN